MFIPSDGSGQCTVYEINSFHSTFRKGIKGDKGDSGTTGPFQTGDWHIPL